MKFLVSWLKEFVEIEVSPSALADRLTLSGFVVESIVTVGGALQGIVTGRIDRIEKHPQADRLVVTSIFDGTTHHQIVTGATNVFEGAVVPVCLPGSVLTNGTVLQKAKLRGIDSFGMLCSKSELGLEDASGGIWILPPETPLGVDFVQYAHLVETVLDVAILPNRGDCQSLLGLARELSVMFEIPLRLPVADVQYHSDGATIAIDVQADDLCSTYHGIVVDHVHLGASPLWMQRRLELCGLRSINTVVDITNYVLLEMGQPLHAFDYNRLSGAKVAIRRALASETLETLDGEKRVLSEGTLVIADAKSVLAVAGVMGGQLSGVQSDTKRILLEAAHFLPTAIRRASQSLGLRTESSIRFEKGVDSSAVAFCAQRAGYLLQTLALGRASSMVSVEKLVQAKKVPFSVEGINRCLDTTYSDVQIKGRLTALGFEILGSEVQVPSWRSDIDGMADLAEEIIRLDGFDGIVTKLPQLSMVLDEPATLTKIAKKAEAAMIYAGFSQVVTAPMIGYSDLEGLFKNQEVLLVLKNPLTPAHAVLRPMLLPSLLQSLSYNLKRQREDISLFEIGKTFCLFEGKPSEALILGAVITGKPMDKAYRSSEMALEVDFSFLKGVVETVFKAMGYPFPSFEISGVDYCHPKQQLVLKMGDEIVGMIAQLHPTTLARWEIQKPLYTFEINLSVMAKIPSPKKSFRLFSKYPSTRRDIALLAPVSLSYQDIEDVISRHKSPWITQFWLFDWFRSDKLGEDKKSVGIAFIYQDPDKSLSDEEVNQAHQDLGQTLVSTLPVSIR